MRRRDLLTAVGVAVTAGCLEPTGSPPPHPQGSFEFEFETVDGAELVRVTAKNIAGDVPDPRVRIGDDVVYDGGEYSDEYAASAEYVDEGADGLETGDVLELTRGGSLPENKLLWVETPHPAKDEYVALGRKLPP